jgi:hypothetical protein
MMKYVRTAQEFGQGDDIGLRRGARIGTLRSGTPADCRAASLVRAAGANPITPAIRIGRGTLGISAWRHAKRAQPDATSQTGVPFAR